VQEIRITSFDAFNRISTQEIINYVFNPNTQTTILLDRQLITVDDYDDFNQIKDQTIDTYTQKVDEQGDPMTVPGLDAGGNTIDLPVWTQLDRQIISNKEIGTLNRVGQTTISYYEPDGVFIETRVMDNDELDLAGNVKRQTITLYDKEGPGVAPLQVQTITNVYDLQNRIVTSSIITTTRDLDTESITFGTQVFVDRQELTNQGFDSFGNVSHQLMQIYDRNNVFL